jgi:hypothetical protein
MGLERDPTRKVWKTDCGFIRLFCRRETISDAELVTIFNRAILVVYTSRLEPFGFAPREANACALSERRSGRKLLLLSLLADESWTLSKLLSGALRCALRWSRHFLQGNIGIAHH